MNNSVLINLIYIFIVAPVLYTLATNQFPEQYKQWIMYFAVAIALFHGYKLFMANNYIVVMEGLDAEMGDAHVHHVQIFDSNPGYSLPKLRVKIGDVVVWTNIGNRDHSATALNQEFNSGYLRPGDTFTIKFTGKGTYPYYSIPDKGWMRGVIIVS